MAAKRIVIITGPAPAFNQLPSLSFGEPGISTDTNLLFIGTGTSSPHVVQTSHSTLRVDYSNTPGVIQSIVQTKTGSDASAPAFQVNTNNASPSGICEPGGDGDVGVVIKGNLVARFSPTGLQLNGALTYTGQGGVILSNGPTAQRPGTPIHGFLWHNTTLDILEWWDGTTWRAAGTGSGGSAAEWSHLNHTNNNYAVQPGDRLICNTDTAAFTIVLPASPPDKAEVEIIGDFGTRYLTIARNGKQIVRKNEDFIMTKDNSGLRLVYDDNISSWRVKP
jgi:hypothetical protein